MNVTTERICICGHTRNEHRIVISLTNGLRPCDFCGCINFQDDEEEIPNDEKNVGITTAEPGPATYTVVFAGLDVYHLDLLAQLLNVNAYGLLDRAVIRIEQS